MATLLTITNRVLRRLREDTVTGTTDSEYAGLVAEFVSEIHQEVINAHEWEQFKSLVQFDIVADQKVYNLSATTATGGDVTVGYDVARKDSALRFDSRQQPLAFYFRPSSSSYGWPMIHVADDDRRRLEAQNNTLTADYPSFFSLRNDGTNLYLDMPWAPSGSADHAEIDFLTEPALLESDGTDDDTVITLNERAIYLGAVYLAVNERGEEIGEPGNMAERRYYEALAAAIEKDHKHDEMTNQYDWYRS